MTEKIVGSVVTRFFYNTEDRLERVEDGSGGVIATYYYDPFGRRLWKDVGGSRTHFHYSDEGLVGEYDGSGAEIKTYGWKPGSTWTTDPVFMKQGTQYYWYHNDHLGTPQVMTTNSGAVVWSARYTSFLDATIDSSSTVTNNLRVAGQYFDAETGLHYNRHRYYDPKAGRYLRVDPIRFQGGLNLYTYISNKPLSMIDPFGLTGIDEGDPKLPNESNCLGHAMTGRTDNFRYPDVSKGNPNDSFVDALSKKGWKCHNKLTSSKDCKCSCGQQKILIAYLKKDGQKDLWYDPKFPWNPKDGSTPIHAARGKTGCSDKYTEVMNYSERRSTIWYVSKDRLGTFFEGEFPLLCCCKD